MAGLHHPLRPTSHSFLPSSSSANLTPHLSGHHFASRILLILAFLPLSLAIFAFFLQWRGGFNDPISHSSPHRRLEFPGMQSSASPYGNTHCDRVSADVLSQSSSLAFPYFRELSFNHRDFNPGPKVCVTTSTSAGLEQILPWIFYHKVIGISDFFLFVEGKAAASNVSRVLQSIPGVKVIFRTKELEEQQSKSRIWNETWLGNFFYKPCNYELFVRQTLNMEMAIVMARSAGMDWIFHLDTDELIYPAGTREYSVRELLSNIAQEVDIVVFPNYESGVEHAQVREPFSEVSLFKKNYDHLPKETYFGSYKEATRGNPNYFLTYGNGKSAARLQDHLRPNGAHRWQNYNKTPIEIKLDEPAVLHYTYTKYSDLTSRRDRCGCKPTKEDVKRCFMLEFDRDAFIIASTVTQEEMMRWYQDRVVWGNKDLKLKLMRKGILTRIYAPMIIIQGLKESGVFTSVITSAQASSSENRRNSTWEERKSFINEPSRRSSSTAARKIMEIVDLRSDHPMAVEPLSPPSPDEILHAVKHNTH